MTAANVQALADNWGMHPNCRFMEDVERLESEL